MTNGGRSSPSRTDPFELDGVGAVRSACLLVTEDGSRDIRIELADRGDNLAIYCYLWTLGDAAEAEAEAAALAEATASARKAIRR